MKTYTLQFRVFDRIALMGLTDTKVLPDLSKYEIGVVIQDVRRKLELPQDELKRVEFRTTETAGGKATITWNNAKDKSRAFTFTELEFKTIRDSMERLNKDEKLPTTAPWLALYEKIVDAKPNVDKGKPK